MSVIQRQLTHRFCIFERSVIVGSVPKRPQPSEQKRNLPTGFPETL
jgi:hypothetical protein